MISNQALGKYGEDRAADYLHDRGYQIVERNWRCSVGEIDLVAQDANRLVFVEVKTRSGSGYGHPFEAINPQKVSRMRRLVAQWCATHEISGVTVRLDAIAVLVSHGRVSIEHLKQVY
ncbi:MAG: hypothetical protein RL716_686 [Actinomycetota bacterium]|jgi:putative endonuclease